MLGALASLPAVVVAGAMAGTREEFSAGLARNPQLMGFATARAEVFNALMTTLSGRLPSDLTGVLWRNGPAEHERFGHRYWLIGPYLDVGREATRLNVFDAKHISDGPVWQGILPYPLPLGLHGTFAKS